MKLRHEQKKLGPGTRIRRDYVLPLFVVAVLLVALTVSYPFQVVALVSALYLVSIPFAWQSHRKLLLADRNLASDDDGDCEDTDLDHLGDKHKGDAS